MPLPDNSMTLVPAGAQSSQGPGFAQQGSVDWVALGQTQFSASIAILGRLSSAGIEPLTVAVGQAICSKLPLGVHGEGVLNKAMANLQAFSSFGDMIWFGVGIRHILRVLVQNAQGASLVALCAGLSEGHDESTCALILYEVAKRFGGPRDLTPSFSQWEALVKVCSSVFCQSTLGLRIDQLLKLGGYTDDTQWRGWTGHPQDLAEVILALGDVASGSIQEIHISGGPGCNWVAAFADQILGLRVAVRSIDGAVLSMNYDSSIKTAQIDLRFCNDVPGNSISCTSRIFCVRYGNDFIKKCFVGFSIGGLENDFFVAGRVKWDSMFRETFGKDAEDLLSPSSAKPFVRILPEPLGLDDHFAQLFAASAAIYTFSTNEEPRYANSTDFVLVAMSSIPELCPHRQKLLKAASQYTKLPAAKSHFAERYNIVLYAYHHYSEAKRELGTRCTCSSHRITDLGRLSCQRVYCLPKIAETAFALSCYLGSLSLHEPLMPKRYGIHSIYNDLRGLSFYGEAALDQYSRTDMAAMSPSRREIILFKFLQRCLGVHQALVSRFQVYITLFSGARPTELTSTSISAMSDGKVYCYIDTLQNLSDRLEKASTIHVGAGSIQAGNRLYYHVLDRIGPIENFGPRYQVQKVDIIEKGLCPFAEDFTSSDLRIEAVIEESVRLSFWYRVSSTAGEISIFPAHFVHHELAEALHFKNQLLSNVTSSHDSGIVDQQFSVIHGEGIVSQPISTRISVRPHRGNTLGRCVALVTSSGPVALLSSEGDLSIFMELWAFKDEDKDQRQGLRFTLIS